jgi:hypothetical protein
MKLGIHLLILALFLSVSTGASDKPKLDGKTLLQEGEDKADIFALPFFEIKATIRVENLGKTIEGSYSFLWNGPEAWREHRNTSTPGAISRWRSDGCWHKDVSSVAKLRRRREDSNSDSNRGIDSFRAVSTGNV